MANNADIYGTKREPICCEETNSGLFYSALSSGNIHTISSGKDTLNDFTGQFFGINLTYAKVSGKNPKTRSGARVFKFALSNSDLFETYIVNDDLSIDKQLQVHQKPWFQLAA